MVLFFGATYLKTNVETPFPFPKDRKGVAFHTIPVVISVKVTGDGHLDISVK